MRQIGGVKSKPRGGMMDQRVENCQESGTASQKKVQKEFRLEIREEQRRDLQSRRLQKQNLRADTDNSGSRHPTLAILKPDISPQKAPNPTNLDTRHLRLTSPKPEKRNKPK
jgi:hypothetical protein